MLTPLKRMLSSEHPFLFSVECLVNIRHLLTLPPFGSVVVGVWVWVSSLGFPLSSFGDFPEFMLFFMYIFAPMKKRFLVASMTEMNIPALDTCRIRQKQLYLHHNS